MKTESKKSLFEITTKLLFNDAIPPIKTRGERRIAEFYQRKNRDIAIAIRGIIDNEEPHP